MMDEKEIENTKKDVKNLIYTLSKAIRDSGFSETAALLSLIELLCIYGITKGKSFEVFKNFIIDLLGAYEDKFNGVKAKIEKRRENKENEN